MSILTNIFYITSIALMIPVMLALLFGLVYTLYLSGTAIREAFARLKAAPSRRRFTEALENRNPDVPEPDVANEFGRTLKLILTRGDDRLLIGKRIAELESSWRKELQKVIDMTKYGPALGLMGTLIPLGPALVGLADGDLRTMSANMIVAFATTVVGVLISLIALAVSSVKQRWYRDDSILLAFAAQRCAESFEGVANHPNAETVRTDAA